MPSSRLRNSGRLQPSRPAAGQVQTAARGPLAPGWARGPSDLRCSGSCIMHGMPFTCSMHSVRGAPGQHSEAARLSDTQAAHAAQVQMMTSSTQSGAPARRSASAQRPAATAYMHACCSLCFLLWTAPAGSCLSWRAGLLHSSRGPGSLHRHSQAGGCCRQLQDEEGIKGILLQKNVVASAGRALLCRLQVAGCRPWQLPRQRLACRLSGSQSARMQPCLCTHARTQGCALAQPCGDSGALGVAAPEAPYFTQGCTAGQPSTRRMCSCILDQLSARPAGGT